MGVLTLFVIALEIIASIYASKRKNLVKTLLFCASTFILTYEIASFFTTHKMPIAFSHFSYFLFAIAVFLPSRRIKSIASFCAFVSGAVYLAGWIVYPDVIYANQPFESVRMVGFLLHNMMLFGALLLYTQIKLEKLDVLYVLAFVAFIVVYTEVAVHICASDQANFLTVGVIEATLIHQIAPSFALKWWWYILWYALVAVAFWGMWELTSFINRLLLRQ